MPREQGYDKMKGVRHLECRTSLFAQGANMTPSIKEYSKYRVSRHSVEQPEDPSIRFIPLTQGQVAIVDVGDFAALDRWNWSAHWNPCTKSFYALRSTCRSKGSKAIYLHREIMGLSDGDPLEVDHIQSGNTLDNRRSNLRIVTKQQNMMNKRTYKNNTVGVRGITMEKGRYRAQLQVEGKRVYLPRVDTLEEAVRLRKEAVEKYHGEYACS